jgi:hypothetical protein
MARFHIPSVTNLIGVLGLWVALAIGVAILVGSAITAMAPRSAQALPAYTQQTGLPCSQCHTNPAGGRDLTDFGKQFQANGDKLKK